MGEFPHIFFQPAVMALEHLLDPIRQHVTELGFELVDFRAGGGGERPQLQLRIDRPGSTPGHGVTVDDCVRVSRSIEHLLERSEPVGRYVLQVSSPGLERPVRFPEHWRRYRGRFVRVRARSLKGHPRAQILDVPDDRHVVLRLADRTEVTLELTDLRDATLVPEDAAPDTL